MNCTILHQKALDPVTHSIYLFRSPVNGRSVYSRQTGVDGRSRSAGLSDDYISFHN